MQVNGPNNKCDEQPEINRRISVGKYVMNLLTGQRNSAP